LIIFSWRKGWGGALTMNDWKSGNTLGRVISWRVLYNLHLMGNVNE
jgi:hypothetical protein